MNKWTLEQLSKHIEINSSDTYSMAVVLSALYKKLYSQYPHFGLSGFQASAADQVLAMLPDTENEKPHKEVGE